MAPLGLGIIPKHHPKCTDLYEAVTVDSKTVITHISLLFTGLLSNLLLQMCFSGRAKLSTASFAYIRIMGIVQFIFFMLPFPLKIFTDHYQRGKTWVAANFLPVVLGLFHFMVAAMLISFCFRLQMCLNYIRRSRRWSSHAWIAWRKICWLIPFGIIANTILCFEYQIKYEQCQYGNQLYAIGYARLSEAAVQGHFKFELIRCVPTFMFWISFLITVSFIMSERCILPKLGSPYAAKHIPLFANLRPLLLAQLCSQSVIHVYTTYHLIRNLRIPEETRLSIYAASYSLPFPLMLLFSTTFRSHMFHIFTKIFQGRQKVRKDSTLRRISKQFTRVVAYSKLEMENSEIDDRNLAVNNSIRSLLRDDAVYRVRFAIPQDVIIEESEDFDSSIRQSIDAGVNGISGSTEIVDSQITITYTHRHSIEERPL